MKRSSFLKSLPFIFAAPKVLAEIAKPNAGDIEHGCTQEQYEDFLEGVFAPREDGKAREMRLLGCANSRYSSGDIFTADNGKEKFTIRFIRNDGRDMICAPCDPIQKTVKVKSFNRIGSAYRENR